MTMSTINLPDGLHERISRGAASRGLTPVGFMEILLDAYERRQRMESFGRAFQTADDQYWDEFHQWDVTLTDGLEDD